MQCCRELLAEAQGHFKARNRKLTLETLKSVIVRAARRKDMRAIGATFLFCLLIEYYYQEYSAACEYAIELARSAGMTG